MGQNPYVITVPNALNSECMHAELFYTTVLSAPLAGSYVLDLKYVSFLTPYGVIALMNAARILHQQTLVPVEFVNIRSKVHSYLERIDALEPDLFPIFCKSSPEDIWSRSENSITVLELTLLQDEDAIDAISRSAKHIFTTHLGEDAASLIVIVLNELCSNVLSHSRDPHGTILIQRCVQVDDPNVASVRVAVSDLGWGIHESLSQKHPELDTPAKALDAAFKGRTSRERGGLGLRTVANHATNRGGHVWLRTETVALHHTAESTKPYTGLSPIPGTQVAVELRVPIEPQGASFDEAPFFL